MFNTPEIAAIIDTCTSFPEEISPDVVYSTFREWYLGGDARRNKFRSKRKCRADPKQYPKGPRKQPRNARPYVANSKTTIKKRALLRCVPGDDYTQANKIPTKIPLLGRQLGQEVQ
jgi:hypothetical protein